MDSFVIQTRNLSKLYGRVQAVKRLNLTVPRRGITAFLGRNGAGKSTTLKMLLGMVTPSSGSGTVCGCTIGRSAKSIEIRRQVAYVGEDKGLYLYMTAGQLIQFTRSFYPDWQFELERKLLKEYNLPVERKIRSLSKGMRTKLALLLAFARRSKLVILDEPSEGLDPEAVEGLLQTIIGIAADGTAVFFSSHQIAEVERIADRVCIIEGGRLIMNLSMERLRESYRRLDLLFPVVPPAGNFRMPGVENVVTDCRQMVILASGNTEAIVDRARSLGAVSVGVTPIGLREVFLQAVKAG